jgi:hypothetical protein
VAVAVLMSALVAGGCGWSPPGTPPPEPDKCTAADGPTAETDTNAINSLPQVPPGPWVETARGHTKNCHLYWVQVSAGKDPTAPQHLLLFDHNTPIGTATPQPRPYTTVLGSGEDTITVSYQVGRPGENSTVSQVRFQLGTDGKLKALDPLPG